MQLELQLSGTCPGTYSNSPSTFIRSPNYPLEYDNNATCSWLITNSKEKSIILEFEVLWTEQLDGLYVYEGQNKNGKLVCVYKGSYIDPGCENPWVNAKSLYLTFITDDFLINYLPYPQHYNPHYN